MKNIVKFRLTRHLLSLAMGVGMLGVLIVGNVGTALADGIVGTANVDAGTTLSATINAGSTSISGGSHTALSGISQPNLPMAMPIDVVNDLGTGTAWTVSIKAEDFHTNAGSTDYVGGFTHSDCNTTPANPTSASETRCLQNTPAVTAASATTYSGSTGVAPTNTASTISALTSSDQTLFSFSAADHTGMGKFTVTPTMHLNVKDSDYAGSYSSHITVTIA